MDLSPALNVLQRTMAKKPKLLPAPKTVQKHPGGAPTKYRPQFCQMLMDHMKQGGSFESFGAIAECHRDTLYAWLEPHPEFSDAKKRGTDLSLKFYEEMGKMIATGQMRRLVKEEPMVDKKGKPMLNPATGEVMYKREYAPAVTSTGAWVFMLKNMHGWRDQRNLQVSGDGQGGPIKLQAVEMSAEEKLKEIREMHKFLSEVGDDDVIEITPGK